MKKASIDTSVLTSGNTDLDSAVEKILLEFNFSQHLNEESLALVRCELIEKYQSCYQHLDSDFLKNLCSPDKVQRTTRLWELIIADYLIKCQAIKKIHDHKNAGPDWKITLQNGKEYYIEATCAGLPEKNEEKRSEIHRVLDIMQRQERSSAGVDLISEAKSRISSVIRTKLDKHCELVKKSQCGYLLLVSYGSLPFYATCDLYNAVKTIYPFGDLTLHLTESSSYNPELIGQSFAYQDAYRKISSLEDVKINTDIFGNAKYEWVSAILFSKVEVCLLLEQAKNLPHINWNGINNDFVLVHNPSALCPLAEDLFNSKTRLKIQDNKLVLEGKNIFPTIA